MLVVVVVVVVVVVAKDECVRDVHKHAEQQYHQRTVGMIPDTS